MQVMPPDPPNVEVLWAQSIVGLCCRSEMDFACCERLDNNSARLVLLRPEGGRVQPRFRSALVCEKALSLSSSGRQLKESSLRAIPKRSDRIGVIVVLEGFGKMPQRGPRNGLVLSAELRRFRWRRWLANGKEMRADTGECMKESFPDSVGCGRAHHGFERLKGLLSVPGLGGDPKKTKEFLGIEKAAVHFVSDPNTKRSAASLMLPPIGAKSTNRSNSFLLDVLRVVSAKEAVTVKRSGAFAMRAGRALQPSETLITLLFRLANPVQDIVPQGNHDAQSS